MESDRFIGGVHHQGNSPTWTPLERLIGTELAPMFMWMFELRLSDGIAMHAYKHRWTRRYIHLAEDGRTFYYAGTETYEQVDRRTAIAGAFTGWESSSPTEAQRAALEEVLRRELDAAA